MSIILIGSKKGGVGKSTLATNIAAFLANNGKKVVLIDSDRQSTTSNWAHDRSESEYTYIPCVQKYDNVKSTLRDMATHYEYVVVDCQGRDSLELRTGLLAANLAIIPCCPSQADLDTMSSVVDVIKDASELNESLKAAYIITKASTNPAVTEINEAREYLSRFEILNPIQTIISERKIYRDAIAIGAGVVELDNSKASSEIKKLMKEISSWQ